MATFEGEPAIRELNLKRAREWGTRKIAAAVCSAWLLLCGIAGAEEPADILFAGTARKDITPAQPVMLAGYGNRTGLSQGVHDPLSVRVVAFQQDGRKLVLVSTDLVGFYGGTAASMRKAILDECRLQPSELFLAAIHTHAAPTVRLDVKVHVNNEQYVKTLQTQLVAAVSEALAHTVPVRIAMGTGSSPIAACRREFAKSARGKTGVRLGRDPSVLTDREVQVLRVCNADSGGLAAVVFDYASHSTALGPQNYLVSGDVHGLAEQFLEKYLAGGVVAPGFAGASGNVDPWYRVLPAFKTENGWIPEPVLMGTMLGEEVSHVLDGMKKPGPNGPIKTAIKTLALSRKQDAKSDKATNGETPDFNLTVGRLGNVAVVGIGGEVFSELGLAIKKGSPFPHTLIITHCNGAAGYVPTKEAYHEGGYEVTSSHFAPEAADELVQEALRLLREL